MNIDPPPHARLCSLSVERTSPNAGWSRLPGGVTAVGSCPVRSAISSISQTASSESPPSSKKSSSGPISPCSSSSDQIPATVASVGERNSYQRDRHRPSRRERWSAGCAATVACSPTLTTNDVSTGPPAPATIGVLQAAKRSRTALGEWVQGQRDASSPANRPRMLSRRGSAGAQISPKRISAHSWGVPNGGASSSPYAIRASIPRCWHSLTTNRDAVKQPASPVRRAKSRSPARVGGRMQKSNAAA